MSSFSGHSHSRPGPLPANTARPRASRRWRLPFSRGELERALAAMLEDAGHANCRVELVILDDAAMAALHKKSLDRTGPTNILSFPATAGPADRIWYEFSGAPPRTPLGEMISPRPPHTAGQRFALSGEMGVQGTQSPAGEVWRGEAPPEKQTSCKIPGFDKAKAPRCSNPDQPNQDGLFIGSLALSADTFARECFLYGQKAEEHCLRLLAHGLAHLLGLEHGPAMHSLTERLERAALNVLPRPC